MKKVKYLSMILISLLIVSCTEKDDYDFNENIHLNKKEIANYGLYEIYNDNNPFDVIGVYHNMYLNKIGTKLSLLYGDDFYMEKNWKTSDELINAIQNLSYEIAKEELETPTYNYNRIDYNYLTKYTQNQQIAISSMLNKIDTNIILFDNFYASSLYTENTKSFYDQISNKLQLYYTQNKSLDEIFTDLTIIENDILSSNSNYHTNYNEMAETNENFNDVDNLLIFISVLKHSIVYWANAYNYKNNVWHNAINYLINTDLSTNYTDKSSNPLKKLWGKIKDFFTENKTRQVRSTIVSITTAIGDTAGTLTLGPLFGGAFSGLILTGGIGFIAGS